MSNSLKALFLVVSLFSSLSFGRGEISKREFSRAASIVKGVDYLPFSYTTDGCYGRSYYLAMELAAAGIAVSSQYVLPKTGKLEPAPGKTWDYHVAPMVWVKSDTEPMIFDPYFSEQPILRSRWITLLNAKDGVELYWAEGNIFGFNEAAKEQPGPVEPTKLPSLTREMSPFHFSDVVYACREMKGYIDREVGLSAEAKREKQERLIQRTLELVAPLQTRGLLPVSEEEAKSLSECF